MATDTLLSAVKEENTKILPLYPVSQGCCWVLCCFNEIVISQETLVRYPWQYGPKEISCCGEQLDQQKKLVKIKKALLKEMGDLV
jgi:hypothetical protein